MNPFYIEKFLEIIWEHIHFNVTSAECRANLVTEHSGIASGYVDTIFGVCQPTGELIPAFNVLDLIKEQYRAFAVHLHVYFQ